MESIYYVMSWQCHRKCDHCYEERFHPYHGAELDEVVSQATQNFARIIANFPERMTYLDPNDPAPSGEFREKVGKIILAGGEVLVTPIRERVLYPAIDQIRQKYGPDGARVVIQTTGDLLTGPIIDELLARGVWRITVSGIDSFHVGLETEEAQRNLVERLTGLFESRGMKPTDLTSVYGDHSDEQGATFMFFGAQPDSWIGRIWPRGRAMKNSLSTATLADNFCNRWSGGLNFLQYRYAGSEVSVEPTGNVYPCCAKTKLPIGNLLSEKLESIIERHIGDPVYEAISMGHPERMGITHGWTLDTFLEKSKVELPDGRTYQNLCLGCDRFHEEVLIPLALQRKKDPTE
jgi:hypothetical protein